MVSYWDTSDDHGSLQNATFISVFAMEIPILSGNFPLPRLIVGILCSLKLERKLFLDYPPGGNVRFWGDELPVEANRLSCAQ